MWDGVLNSSRDLLRTAVACESLLGRSRTQRLVDLTCAYGMALEGFVCQRPTSSKELDALLTNPGDRATLQLAANGPLAIVELLTLEAVEAGRESKPLAESVHFPRLLGFIDELGHHVTSCQRLMKPPVPPVFYGHAMRFLTLWTFTLPLALLPTLPQWALVPSVGFVTWALFGLRELVRRKWKFRLAGLESCCADLIGQPGTSSSARLQVRRGLSLGMPACLAGLSHTGRQDAVPVQHRAGEAARPVERGGVGRAHLLPELTREGGGGAGRT